MSVSAVAEITSAAPTAAPAAPKGPAMRRSLLVIDDEEVQRMHVRSIARNIGFDVDEAETIDEAMERMAEKDYDAVVVDLSLGQHDGVQVLRNIAKSGKRPDVIVVSGFEDRIRDAVVRFGRAVGLSVIGEFKKPLKPAAFKQCLANATARADRKAELKVALNIPAEAVRDAIMSGEVVPVYQPQVSLETGEIVGVEALARWKSAKFGNVSPDVFVTIAENNGLARLLTQRILKQAVRDAAPWCLDNEDFRVAVNVSATVLSDLQFPEEVMSMLDEVGMAPHHLTIEVTETTALADLVANADVMSRLCIKGVQLSLDDFGTGFSSLSSLRNFPFGEIKIDRSFVSDVHHDMNAWTIVQATIALAKARGMRTVAEGIETQVVADLLAREGVDFGQGYLYARPMAASEIADRLPVSFPTP